MRDILELRLQLSLSNDNNLRTRLTDSPEGEINDSQPFPVNLAQHLGADFFIQDARMVAKIGRELFDSLGQIGRWLSSFRAYSSSQQTMRLYLHFEEPRLAALPWEVIHDGRNFFALSTDLSLIRVWGGLQPPITLNPVDPLKIAVAIAQPNDMDDLPFQPEPKILQDALAIPLDQDQVELRIVEKGKLKEFRKILDMGTHLIHFFGYQVVESGEPSLIFIGDSDQAEAVGGAALHDLFDTAANRPRVVILTTQDAPGQNVRIGTSTRLARSINQAGVPVVIGFQGDMGERAVLTFTRTVYQALADRLNLDQALAHARVAINSESGARSGEWAVPVLYSIGPLPDTLLAFKESAYGTIYNKSYESYQSYQGISKGIESIPVSSGMNPTDAYTYSRELREAVKSDRSLSPAEQISLQVLVDRIEDAVSTNADAAFIERMLDELSVYSSAATDVANEMRQKLIG